MKPYYEHAGITIYHGDAREIVPELGLVDMVLTDPPYGIGFAAQPTKWQRLAGQQPVPWDVGNVKYHTLERLDSMIEAVSGKRLTYARLTA